MVGGRSVWRWRGCPCKASWTPCSPSASCAGEQKLGAEAAMLPDAPRRLGSACFCRLQLVLPAGLPLAHTSGWPARRRMPTCPAPNRTTVCALFAGARGVHVCGTQQPAHPAAGRAHQPLGHAGVVWCLAVARLVLVWRHACAAGRRVHACMHVCMLVGFSANPSTPVTSLTSPGPASPHPHANSPLMRWRTQLRSLRAAWSSSATTRDCCRASVTMVRWVGLACVRLHF